MFDIFDIVLGTQAESGKGVGKREKNPSRNSPLARAILGGIIFPHIILMICCRQQIYLVPHHGWFRFWFHSWLSASYRFFMELGANFPLLGLFVCQNDVDCQNEAWQREAQILKS